MIFFIDFGLFAVLALAACAGAAGALASWILSNIIIVIILFILKSFLLFSGCGLFAVKENTMHLLCSVLVIIIDVIRNMIFLYCIAQILGGMLSGGLFHFFMGILNFIIGGPLLLLAGEGPMYLVYDWGMEKYDETKFAILLEFVAIAAILLVAWWGGVFG